MNKNDSNSDPLDQADPLSATGMFLSSFGSAPAQEASEALPAKADPFASPASGAGTTRADWAAFPPVTPASANAPTSKSGPGEFTQMFQAMESKSSPAATPPVSVPLQPPPAIAQPPASSPASSQGQGEFTRIFVSGSTPSAEPRAREQGARTIVEPPHIPAAAANPSRMKGFSTPGISDSASAEGSFTQFFKATPAPTPASTPVPPVQSYRPPVAPAPPLSETPWQREPEFSANTRPADAPPSSPSATGLLSALSSSSPSSSSPFSSGSYSSGPLPPEPTPYRPEPIPSYTPAPPPEPSAMEAGSVTKLIQRLSQVPREAPPEPVMPVSHAPAPPPPSAALGEPGEFTRMISGHTVEAALGRAAAAPPPPQPAPAAPHMAMPAITPPAITPPAITPPTITPAAVHAPKVEPPKVEPPKVALPKFAPPAIPALAAPKSKLEAMVPILLVLNTFLLVVLLVVVIFALKAK